MVICKLNRKNIEIYDIFYTEYRVNVYNEYIHGMKFLSISLVIICGNAANTKVAKIFASTAGTNIKEISNSNRTTSISKLRRM